MKEKRPLKNPVKKLYRQETATVLASELAARKGCDRRGSGSPDKYAATCESRATTLFRKFVLR